ncbi:DUF6204 family protein [Streptomyces sp. NPDC057424]|uniref:DUF6204 family protein n=1 Tax=Streptomyces sp. NPDC057424 TaxID=3346127 RepID=UPI003690B1C6
MHPHHSCHRPRRLRRAERRAAGAGCGARRAARFTPAGSLTYDVAVRPAVTFRLLGSGEPEEDIPEARKGAEEPARVWLEQRRYGYRNLGSTAEDLSRPPRRAAAAGGRPEER